MIKRTFFNCPKCKCFFFSLRDLQYHLLTHIPQPRAAKRTKTVLPLDLRREKYAEKLRLFRLNYSQPGQQLNRDRVQPKKNYWKDGRKMSLRKEEI